MIDKRSREFALALVLIHLAVSIVHGAAHSRAGVLLNLFGNLYVLAIIMIGPIIAVILLYTNRSASGAWMFMLTMAGSLVFGLLYHFVFRGSDNVVSVNGPWHSLFTWSAVGIAVLEFLGTIFGLWLIRRAAVN